MKTVVFHNDRKYDVEFNFSPGSAQTWDYPGDPPELEVIKVEDEDGNEVPLTEELDEQISNEIFDNLDQHLPDDYYGDGDDY